MALRAQLGRSPLVGERSTSRSCFRQCARKSRWVCRGQQHRHVHAHDEPLVPQAVGTRRQLLAGSALAGILLDARNASAVEWFGLDVARKVLRPDGEEQQAIVALMDARSTLKELAELAATPIDSEERFKSRYLLPAYAKRLREVATSAPILAQSIAGDKESTLSEKYGGTGQGSTLTDPVYESLGKILTISGRTIKEEAQVNPAVAKEGADILTTFLSYLPDDKLRAAQEFRIQRSQ